MSYIEYLKSIQRLYLDHLLASIISSAVRASPGIPKDEFDAVLAEAVNKEISAGINICPQATFDFRCIFDDRLSSRSISLTDRMTPNPVVASDTYSLFCRARSKLDGLFILPSLGSKTVGHMVRSSFWEIYYSSNSTFMHKEGRVLDVSTTDCSRLYLETGCYPSGPVELRTAWTYNQLEPRVYYARGGDVLRTSQYVQTVANILVDAFPETHRRNRFMPPQSPLQPDDVELIYDYSSFTSNLDVVVLFIKALADFMRGTTVYLIDLREGIIPTDLGDLLDAYNSDCNLYSSFDASRVTGHPIGSVILQHTCGMLGVEGNIFLATLLHGIHLRFIAGIGRSRCVGDDARYHVFTEDGSMDDEELTNQYDLLRGCGLLKKEKMAKFEKNADPLLQAYRYVKRPLSRESDFMIEGILLTIPSIVSFGALDNLHTVHPSTTHPARKVYAQILRFIQELHVHNLVYDEASIVWKSILKHILFLRNHCKRMDPDGKHSMYKSSSYLTHYGIPCPHDWGKESIEEWITNDIGYEEVVRFPSFWCREAEGTCDGRVGSLMVRQGSKARSVLQKMGYLRRTDLFDEVSMYDVGVEQFHVYLSGEYSSYSQWEVMEDIPVWWAHVSKAL